MISLRWKKCLTRRFRRWKGSQETEAGPGAKPDASFSFLPDLIIIDGGKGQLSRVVKVLEQYDLFGKVPVVGLAKQEEEIFFPHKSVSLCCCRAIRRDCILCSASVMRRIGMGLQRIAKNAQSWVWHLNWIRSLVLGLQEERRS